MAATEHRGTVMACRLHIVIHQPAAPVGVQPAVDLLDRLESRWSRFLPDSDITRINLAAGAPVAVAAETVRLIESMKAAWDLTQGRYDPTILPLLVANGYGASRIDPTLATALPSDATTTGPVEQIVVDAVGSSVTVPKGIALDPGGIGKGLAADLAVALLLELGARGALVSIGGDLSVGGTPPEPEGWRVDVEHPDGDGPLICRTVIDRGGVATSSTRSRRWRHRGEDRHHAIDPVTGRPSDTDLATATVFAASGWAAEAFATGALLAGSRSVVAYLESHALTGLAVTDSGAVLHTADLDEVVLTATGAS
jgi:thiamine biosynthesis lipoprotein